MSEVIIRSAQPEAVRGQLEAALDSQRRMLVSGIERTRRRLAALEKQYALTTAQLLQRESEGDVEDDNLELIEWLGEARTLERLEAEFSVLEDIQVCS